jgi:hypothetical protein
MTNNPYLSRLHRQATSQDHTLIRQEQCVYCGAAVKPHCGSSGVTRHLDHFLPIRELEIVRRHYPDMSITNWLLPCCPRCNNLAKGLVFFTFPNKFDFVQWGMEKPTAWSIWHNPCHKKIEAVAVSEEFKSVVNSYDDDCLDPVRITRCFVWNYMHNRWRIEKHMIVLCNLAITPSVKSGMAS